MSSKCFDFSSKDFLMLTTYNSDELDYITLLSILKDNKLNKKYISRAEQIHSNKVCYINNPGFYHKADGLITNIESKLILIIKTADCIPLFIYDNIKGIYGLVHAGWRGIVDKVHLNATSKFFDLDSDAKNINVIMGPSIKPCCFEVGNDVTKLFSPNLISKKDNKFFLDLNESIISDFNKLGISKIKVNKTCTYENKKCHSFRRERNNAGRMYSLITYKNWNI